MKIKKTQLALIVGTLCANPAYAEEVFTFDEVVVSATRSEQNLSDVAASVDVVTSQDIDNTLSQSVKQAVQSEPGVTVSGTGRYGNSGFNIRGRDENYVKTVIDGVELPGTYNPGADVMRKYNNTLEVDTLQRIEINKGPISSLYGSDALAGAVIMRTKNPSDLLAGEGDDTYLAVKSGYYSVDESYKATVSLANRTGDLETMLIFTHRQGHEIATFGGPDINGPERGAADPIDFDSDNILAKALYQFNDQHRVGIAFESFNRDQDVTRLSDEGDSIGFPIGPDMYLSYDYADTKAKDEDTRQRYSLEHEWQANNSVFDRLEWQIAYLKSQSNHDNLDTLTKTTTMNGAPISQTTQKRNRQRNGEDQSWQADAQFNKALEFGDTYHELVYGVTYVSNEFALDYRDIDRETGDVVDKTPEVPNAKSEKWGVFIQDQMFLMNDQLVLNGGLRYDHFTASPDSSSDKPDANNSAVTARLGTVYHWNDEFSTYAQVSQGFKAPTLQDLYYFYDTGATFIPNEDLKAEESLSYETGLRFKQPNMRIDMSLFFNDYRNFIEERLVDANGPDGKEVWTTQNIGKAEIYGAELKTQFLLDEWLTDGVYSNFSLAYAKGENKQTGEAIDTVAPLSSYLALGYASPQNTFGSEIAMRAVARKSGSDWSNANNVDNATAPGYAVTDITGYYRPVQDLTLRAGVYNVFDKKYWDYADLAGVDKDEDGLNRRTQPGINWGVELEYVF